MTLKNVWAHIRNKKMLNKKDSGWVTIFTLIILPVLVLLFLWVASYARYSYVLTSIKTDTQTAAVSGATQVTRLGRIDPIRAKNTVKEIYSLNRTKTSKQLRCATANDLKNANEELVTTSDGCAWILTHFSVNATGKILTIGVREFSPVLKPVQAENGEYVIEFVTNATVTG